MATVEALKLVPLPKNTLIVAREDGRLYIVDFTEFPQLDDPGAIDWNISVSKLILGKLQQTRTQLTTLEEVECENIVHTEQLPPGASKDFQITVFTSLDGKNNFSTREPYTYIDSGGYYHALCRVTGQNHQIQLRGTFNVNTLIATIHTAGRR